MTDGASRLTPDAAESESESVISLVSLDQDFVLRVFWLALFATVGFVESVGVGVLVVGFAVIAAVTYVTGLRIRKRVQASTLSKLPQEATFERVGRTAVRTLLGFTLVAASIVLGLLPVAYFDALGAGAGAFALGWLILTVQTWHFDWHRPEWRFYGEPFPIQVRGLPLRREVWFRRVYKVSRSDAPVAARAD
jgi:hypothetical protein